METPDRTEPSETFAQVLAALKDEYRGISDSEISRRIGSHVSTVNNWANGKAIPRRDAIRRLAEEFPRFPETRLFAATGKKTPPPLQAGEREALLEVFDRLTEEQRQMLYIQATAVAESNDQ
ncbi:helix-turn-helix transcriptional regulator [Streptomyces sp. NPDC047028]|uniref:helix-turn-helix transcriptional regulator n=1 Tax=Streptomyces sp. NPDC047028 TaxID=3155793 RepID=UPI00340BE1D7